MLPPATLRVYLAVLRQLPAWRRAAEAVDVATLAASADVSARRVYAALADLTDIGALTWTATGPRSGIVGLPTAGTRPGKATVWDTWTNVSSAAMQLINAVLTRAELDDNEPAPQGWVVKRGAGGVREASAPVAALRLATALLAATWPTQSPSVPSAAVPVSAVGTAAAGRRGWRWLVENAGLAYTPRAGRRPGGVGLPGYTDELPAQVKGPQTQPAATGNTQPPSGLRVSQKVSPLTVQLTRTERDTLASLADREGLTVNACAQRVLADYLNQLPATHPPT